MYHFISVISVILVIMVTMVIDIGLESPLAFAHKHQPHKSSTNKVKTTIILEKPTEKQKYLVINGNYIKDIKPIFQRACFDCHSRFTVFPWYHAIPGIKQWINSDLEEAKKHLEMSEDFPFKSHETPEKDLEELKETILENSMPPLSYKIFHWKDRLTQQEKDKILKWATDSMKLTGNQN
ncbi:heme-binding domain-containing protein [Candidatus Nomurabacteria bacterium]|nr:heme-binding domain-containing protein [Candidatus Nomurabacteria bacterium]